MQKQNKVIPCKDRLGTVLQEGDNILFADGSSKFGSLSFGRFLGNSQTKAFVEEISVNYTHESLSVVQCELSIKNRIWNDYLHADRIVKRPKLISDSIKGDLVSCTLNNKVVENCLIVDVHYDFICEVLCADTKKLYVPMSMIVQPEIT